MSFEQKYLKYKNKYSSLKNMKGGAPTEEVKKLRGALDTISGEIEAANEALIQLTAALSISDISTPKLPLDGRWTYLVNRMTKAGITHDRSIYLINEELKKRTPTVYDLSDGNIDQLIRNDLG